MGFEDCGVWEDIYESKVQGVNDSFELRFGTEEVSQRVADHATSGGDVSRNIGVINEMTGNILGNCGATERSLAEVHGSLNQNILDSITIYSDVPLKKIPIFGGELNSYAVLATQKVGNGLHEAYNGLMNKIGVVSHEIPNYISNKAVAATGGDDASLILGGSLAGIVGMGLYFGKKFAKSEIFYSNK